MSIFDEALHIPAEPRLFEPRDGRFERVLLPLAVRPSWRLALVAALTLVIAAACLVLAVAFLRSPASTLGDRAFELCASAVFAAVACAPAAIFVTALLDLRRGEPFVVVGVDGIMDRRLGGDPIPWSALAKVEILATGVGPCAARLCLKEEGASIFNPFHGGGWAAQWATRRRERIIALLFLSRRPHAIAQTIATLARRNGVAVEQPARVELSTRF